MKSKTQRMWFAPVIALVGILAMGSMSVARAEKDLFPGVTETIKFFKTLSWDRYDPPETSWESLGAGWDVLPGFVEPSFEVESRGWGPPLGHKRNSGHHIWAFDYPSVLTLTNDAKQRTVKNTK